MGSAEIQEFRRRMTLDKEYDECRKAFHEQYEWLESYFTEKFENNEFEEFCLKYGNFYWNIEELREIARRYSSLNPVGNSKKNNEPSQQITQATYFLKHKCSLFQNIEVEKVESEIKEAERWKKSQFTALFYIIRQIRNNLFHGKKMELGNDQYERNKLLIGLAADATKIILDNLIAAEHAEIK